MKSSPPAPRFPRLATRRLVDDILAQRKKMLVLLWELSKQDLGSPDDAAREMLDEFLTLLVDYIATGHFGLYGRFSAGVERRTQIVDTARDIYPRIATTTAVAVDFLERYEGADESTLKQQLAADLSRLAEHITTRIELEDRLITAMLDGEPPQAGEGA